FTSAFRPQRRGQGFGSALIRYITDKADRERKVCYLETDRPGNIPFYEKHGFVLVDSKELSPGVPLWYMRRPAAANG
ncbi:MAG TPA: GNAT family N-acetyltransferase, partial [Turneriella sp.]|nr:GNAT family N-acetyltransferase [Turneriella sp.]